MTDFPDKNTSPPGTEPIPAADTMPATDAALTQPLETADVTPTARLETARLDYDSPTVPLSPVDAKSAPASAAFTRARWAAREGGAGAPSPPAPNDSAPVRLPPADPGGAGRIGATPGPPPQVVPTAVPPVSPVGARPPTAPARAPVARAAAPAPRRRRPRRRPRFATILWGVLLLGFAAFMVARTVLPAPPDPTFWLLGGVILVGLLLVVAGIAAASRRAG